MTSIYRYCFEDIVTINIISDAVNRINNKPALEEFLRKTSLGQDTYIKILELTFEAEPIFKTFIHQDNLFRVKIDGLNTSNPFVRRVVGTRLVEREYTDKVLYDLYYGNNFMDNVFWYRKV
ncbi:hypothetical protein SDC9_52521 [bioreactor metagenome]|jgi:hypothetical protein|uniref:Uncharacterized protein n=1 Tax=bioreactor metagenome TaxID=1076179 RepID=A0A644WQQ6_9ZZZZ